MKTIKWILVNGLFAAALWFGLREGVEGAQNVALFLVWLMCVLGLFGITESAVRANMKTLLEPPAVPEGVTHSFTLAVILFLVWHGFWWTAVAHVVSKSAHMVARGRAKEMSAAETGEPKAA